MNLSVNTRVAIAWGPNQPVEFEDVDLEGPKDREVLVRIVTTSLCHTDVFTSSGRDSEGKFPCILGHGGVGVVEDIGRGQSIIIGVAGAGEEIATRPFQLVTGRAWKGSAFGGVLGRSELPGMVDE